MSESTTVRIAIVGTGYVGATTACTLLLRGLASELVLVDADQRKAEGEALDLSHAAPLLHPARIWTGGVDRYAGSRGDRPYRCRTVLRLELSGQEDDALRRSVAVLESSIRELGLELPRWNGTT